MSYLYMHRYVCVVVVSCLPPVHHSIIYSTTQPLLFHLQFSQQCTNGGLIHMTPRNAILRTSNVESSGGN